MRYRTPYSIWRKMAATGCDFNHVDGKHYVRVVYYDGPKRTMQDDSFARNLMPEQNGDPMLEKHNALNIYAALLQFSKNVPAVSRTI